jgi:hypothetical protein
MEPIYDSQIWSASSFYKETTKFLDNGKHNKSLTPKQYLKDCIPPDVRLKHVTDMNDVMTTLYAPLMVIAESGCIQRDPILY